MNVVDKDGYIFIQWSGKIKSTVTKTYYISHDTIQYYRFSLVS